MKRARLLPLLLLAAAGALAQQKTQEEIDREKGVILEAKIVPPTSQNQGTIEADLRQFVGQRLDLPDEKLTWQCEQMEARPLFPPALKRLFRALTPSSPFTPSGLWNRCYLVPSPRGGSICIYWPASLGRRCFLL